MRIIPENRTIMRHSLKVLEMINIKLYPAHYRLNLSLRSTAGIYSTKSLNNCCRNSKVGGLSEQKKFFHTNCTTFFKYTNWITSPPKHISLNSVDSISKQVDACAYISDRRHDASGTPQSLNDLLRIARLKKDN